MTLLIAFAAALEGTVAGLGVEVAAEAVGTAGTAGTAGTTVGLKAGVVTAAGLSVGAWVVMGGTELAMPGVAEFEAAADVGVEAGGTEGAVSVEMGSHAVDSRSMTSVAPAASLAVRVREALDIKEI